MDAYNTFELFTQLPSELRIKIWKHTFPEPRVLAVRFNRAVSQYTSDTPPPALVHACSESRSLFLETYKRLILSPKYDSAVFIDFARDTLFFDTLDCSPDGDLSLDLALSPHRDRILYCAIDSQLWEVLRVFRYDSLSEVRLMPNLKTVALVMAKDQERGLHQQSVDVDGHQNMFVDTDTNTIGGEIRHVHFQVESLRWDLKQGMETHWTNPPHVQMWLW
ncbi:uncharacterized protein LY89DRAFT_788240 [Mollisia scopiformis]|uniref:2EXR domain-containing protein n=1 Tax=Mollisia scopiformis TaxID=149040 RepID=A0A132BAC8_MOLSC|nr:uncharacterized protein LY89DRAFT_788240 [Mollisia scopiformis]KUJ09356.1 hypothetical protein LY89DRAFT_788240 [Mollisia scopiformis]